MKPPDGDRGSAELERLARDSEGQWRKTNSTAMHRWSRHDAPLPLIRPSGTFSRGEKAEATKRAWHLHSQKENMIQEKKKPGLRRAFHDSDV